MVSSMPIATEEHSSDGQWLPVTTLKSDSTYEYQVARLFGMNVTSATKLSRASLEWTLTPIDHWTVMPVTPHKPAEMTSKTSSPFDQILRREEDNDDAFQGWQQAQVCYRWHWRGGGVGATEEAKDDRRQRQWRWERRPRRWWQWQWLLLVNRRRLSVKAGGGNEPPDRLQRGAFDPMRLLQQRGHLRRWRRVPPTFPMANLGVVLVNSYCVRLVLVL
jgi:hypothetical protein